MARARNIKPGFFTNDQLAEIEPLGRLLFAGLWTIADREGRLEDRPRKIKAEVLPYDDCNADALLNDLAERRFITRYTAGDTGFIQVQNFGKHQNPHIKESASSIPAPCEYGASTVQVPEEHGSSPADSLNPITDSPLLIPDTSIGAKTRSSKPMPVNGPAQVLVKAWADRSGGEPVNYGKSVGQAAQLVKANVSEGELGELYDWFAASPFWQEKGFDLGTCVSQLEKFRQSKRIPKTAGNGRASPGRGDIFAQNMANAEMVERMINGTYQPADSEFETTGKVL